MSRRRYISTDISLDKKVNRLGASHGDFACLLYTWLIPHASDDCSIQRSDDVEELAAMVMPFRRDKTLEEFASAVDGMLELGLLWRREDGLLCLPAEAFYRYQTYIRDKRRETPQNTDEQRKTPQNTASLSLSPSLSLSRAEKQPPPVDNSPKGGESLPSCLSEPSDSVWIASDESQHDTPLRAFWHDVEQLTGSVVSPTQYAAFAHRIRDTLPCDGCEASPDDASRCLQVITKAAAKTKGKPTPLFSKIVEEDR
jgi:hypothetical protein